MNDKKEAVGNLIDTIDKAYKNLLQPIKKTTNSYINEIIININNLLPLIINEQYDLASFLLEKAEAILLADSENDVIKLIDILRYEIKPKLTDYFNILL